MKDWKAFYRKHENCIGALALVALLFGLTASRFGFYYELNDDILIKDVLAGVYSGRPDGHTMQLLYPLGFLLSLLYRLLSIPVFGCFLVLCQYGSIFVIAYRTAQGCKTWQGKLLARATLGTFFEAAFGWHLVFLQYTVTAGMLAAAAVLWFLTTEDADTAGGFIRKNIPAFVLYWLAFCLRSEMGLLLLPLAGVAGLCRWGWEDRIFTKKNIAGYLGTFGVMALGMVILLGADSLAYAGKDWQAFRSFFAERTELYDYQFDFVMNYEENAAAYEAAGVSRNRQQLLENYNFGVDDSIDEALLGRLRESAVNRRQAGGFFPITIKEAFWSLRNRWTGMQDSPMNVVLLMGAVVLLFVGLPKGNKRLFAQVPLCLAAGGVLWMFLLLRNRPVERVLHPLYLGQIVVYLGLLLLVLWKSSGRTAVLQRSFAAMGAVLVLMVTLIRIPGVLSQLEAECVQREQLNAAQEKVMEYCRENPRMLYLEDVYSTVAYNEKINVDRDKPFNFDLLGGWLVKSPLTKQKLSAFGFETMGEAVRAGKNVQLFTEAGTDMQWLEAYFTETGFEAAVLKVGTIAGNTDIYQVMPVGQGEETGWMRPEKID